MDTTSFRALKAAKLRREKNKSRIASAKSRRLTPDQLHNQSTSDPTRDRAEQHPTNWSAIFTEDKEFS